jgi:Peptidase C39 family
LLTWLHDKTGWGARRRPLRASRQVELISEADAGDTNVALLAMMLRHHGIMVPFEEILDVFDTASKDRSLLEMVCAAEHFGLRPRPPTSLTSPQRRVHSRVGSMARRLMAGS